MAALAALAACAGPLAPEPAHVRHVPSDEVYAGGRLHLFIFQPPESRPLDERLRIARRAVAREEVCRWIEAPREVIEAETRRQEGDRYAGTMLVAPLRCG